MANNSSTLVHFAEPSFGVADYVIFSLFLSLSGCIGIFFSFRSKRTTGEYFLGNRKMGPVPIGLSTGVSFMSALAIMGFPAEIYSNGFDLMIATTVGSVSYCIYSCIITRVLFSLRITSIKQYLELRFRSKVLTNAANLMVMAAIFHYMGSCMLGSVIAFTSMTGGQVSIPLGLAIAGAIGVFYTSVGGIKAVVWTDVFQTGIMLLGVLTVLAKSLLDTEGGLARIMAENVHHGRLHRLNWSTDPTVRHTGWSLLLGAVLDYAPWAAQPAGVQRFCATRSLREAFVAAGIATGVVLLFSLLPGFVGLTIFGFYASRGCDVSAAGWIDRNEIIVYFVRERLSIPGFQGLFLAALFSASLSSLSSGLNTATLLMWRDSLRPLLPFELSELRATVISQLFVLILGSLAMLWCYALYSFGGLIPQVTTSTSAAMFSTYGYLFLLAILFSNFNAKAALASLICGFGFTLWLGLGSILRGRMRVIDVFTTTVENCALNVTDTSPSLQHNTTLEDGPRNRGIDVFYSISYQWISTFCFLVSLITGLLVTACTKSRKWILDRSLLFRPCGPETHEERDY